MKRLSTLLFLSLLGGLAPCASASAENQAAPIEEAARRQGVTLRLEGNGRDELKLTATNGSDSRGKIEIPAGLICKAKTGERIVVLRSAQLEVEPRGNSDAQIPAAALSSKNSLVADAPLQMEAESEARLAPLLSYLANRPDVPRATSQLIVLALLENIDFAGWLHFIPVKQPEDAATQALPRPSEIVQAIDAIGVLRAIAPGKEFALATDPELKLRALRNPVCRPKAMQLYGMIILGDAPPGALPPDLSQLLHTKPGDNCPICRMRAQMQAPVD